MSVLRHPWLLATLLWCAVLGSAAGAVYTRHRSRELFAKLEELHRQHDKLDVTWGQLQIEQSMHSAHTEEKARLSLTMVTPAKIQLVVP
jgi:cell division protein FtsL